jgi:A/G-specific adenine glycosylase
MDSAPDFDVEPRRVRRLRRALLAFFDRHARDLPWRRTRDPYAVWVSEVMLQQTRVETVVPYFRRWMERFPTVDALAAADEADVLKAWEGLGYYRRARGLHRGAAMVRERFDGALPSEPERLREIPGVGAYTAGAVASIAFGVQAAAVDGNARRVLSRLADWADPSEARLRDLAAALVDPKRPGDFNQALMELGATICSPRSPRCGACPLERGCLARARGTQEERPARRRRAPVPEIEMAVAVVVVRAYDADGRWRVALVRRPSDGMLGGLWEFPGVERREAEPVAAAASRAVSGLPLDRGVELEAVPHAYSHLRATYRPVLFRTDQPPGGGAGFTWVDRAGLDELALPRAQRTIAERLLEALGQDRP